MRRFMFISGYLFFLVVTGLAGWGLGRSVNNLPLTTTIPIVNPRTLDLYTIENLSKTQIKGGTVLIGEKLSDSLSFSSYLFSFPVDPDFDGRVLKKVTGLINLPKGEGPFPIVLMFRGYVDQKTYTTGMGTKRAGEYFASNGFISIAPDFLGYGGSDKEAENIFESRFQTYATVLILLESLDSLEGWDGQNIFIWGHSNGGQVALTLLEITQNPLPTTLWAPVSKPFPYSVLYYTDESEDNGKLIRRALAKFEDNYDVDLYSLTNYFERIKAPIELHQGTSDEEVPKAWSDELRDTLKKLELEVEYFVYPGADHNLNPSWSLVISRDLSFFQKHLKKY